jgi:hypothetical protein
VWAGLIAASPHGCRVHLSGGEPFGDWERLIDLCRRAKAAALGPLEKVETNAFWATDEKVVADRLAALGEAGMGKISISADPYHQQYVPIERCRLAARVAERVLGPLRVQVRWRDWLERGFDTGEMGEAERAALFRHYALDGRDRLTGRAAAIAPYLPRKPVGDFADKSCRDQLLRSRHVHVDPSGWIMPGTCGGIVLGRARADRKDAGQVVGQVWRRLEADHADRPILGTLAKSGPTGLLPLAAGIGFHVEDGYAGKCHLCWSLRSHLARRGLHTEELGPAWMYGEQRM